MAEIGALLALNRINCGWFLYPLVCPNKTFCANRASLQTADKPLASKYFGCRVQSLIVWSGSYRPGLSGMRGFVTTCHLRWGREYLAIRSRNTHWAGDGFRAVFRKRVFPSHCPVQRYSNFGASRSLRKFSGRMLWLKRPERRAEISEKEGEARRNTRGVPLIPPSAAALASASSS